MIAVHGCCFQTFACVIWRKKKVEKENRKINRQRQIKERYSDKNIRKQMKINSKLKITKLIKFNKKYYTCTHDLRQKVNNSKIERETEMD